MNYPRHAEARERRNALLANRTKAEIAFASHLKVLGIRHQEQSIFHLDIGHYRIVDFYLISPYRIVVEIDGSSHDSEQVKGYDEWKDRKLVTAHRRFRIVRLTNEEVLSQGFRSKLHDILGKYKKDIKSFRKVKRFRFKRQKPRCAAPVPKGGMRSGKYYNFGWRIVEMNKRKKLKYPGLSFQKGLTLAEMKQMGAI